MASDVVSSVDALPQGNQPLQGLNLKGTKIYLSDSGYHEFKINTECVIISGGLFGRCHGNGIISTIFSAYLSNDTKKERKLNITVPMNTTVNNMGTLEQALDAGEMTLERIAWKMRTQEFETSIETQLVTNPILSQLGDAIGVELVKNRVQIDFFHQDENGNTSPIQESKDNLPYQDTLSVKEMIKKKEKELKELLGKKDAKPIKDQLDALKAIGNDKNHPLNKPPIKVKVILKAKQKN